MRFRKKPVIVEAVQWNGFNGKEMADFAGSAAKLDEIRQGDSENKIPPQYDLSIITLEGIMHANCGDYIIKGVKGEFYPCAKDIFEQTYDKVEE